MTHLPSGHWTRRAFAALALLALCFLQFLSAAPQAGSTAGNDNTPQRIILGWRGDPSTSQAVTWRTESMVSTPQGQIAPLAANPDFEKSAASVKAAASEVKTGPGRTAVHYMVDFQGLKPASKYCYRVGDGKIWSEWNIFRTADSKQAPFRFVYLGDAQNGIRSLWSRTIRSAFAAAPDARFITLAGDLIAEGFDDNLWGELCDGMGFIPRMVPLVPTPGNHDLHRPPDSPNSNTVLEVSALWRAHFALPLNGPQSVPELRGAAYYVDYQGLRMISLDANPYANEDFSKEDVKRISELQVAWLREVLARNPNRWTVVVQHQTEFSIAKDRNYPEMRAALLPVYDEYHVDLVLQGHDHSYGRTAKIAGGKPVAPESPGTIYAISVSGSKMYSLTHAFDALMAKTLEGAQLYQIIEVDPDRLGYKAYAVDGALIDSFELIKDQHGASKYLSPSVHN